jgi:hypothetical protein
MTQSRRYGKATVVAPGDKFEANRADSPRRARSSEQDDEDRQQHEPHGGCELDAKHRDHDTRDHERERKDGPKASHSKSPSKGARRSERCDARLSHDGKKAFERQAKMTRF